MSDPHVQHYEQDDVDYDPVSHSGDMAPRWFLEFVAQRDAFGATEMEAVTQLHRAALGLLSSVSGHIDAVQRRGTIIDDYLASTRSLIARLP